MWLKHPMSLLQRSSIWPRKIGYSGFSELVFALGNSQSDIAMPSTFSDEEKGGIYRVTL